MQAEKTSHIVYLADVAPRSKFMASWERFRHGKGRWLVQFLAEAMATFLYTFAGAGSTAAWILGNILAIPALGSLLQIGVAYAVGIVLALTVCLPTSQGHANPAFTIYAMARGHCTPLRGLMLIVAQILGAYIACLLIYGQYYDFIKEAIAALESKGLYDEVMFTSQGPGGIFGLYTTPGDNLGNIFLNEFVCDFVLAVCILASIEPTNTHTPPAMAPWTIGFIYAIVIWGYAPAALAANSARDVGGRLAALTFWGLPASGGRYAAIAALTNIPATFAGGLFYEFVLNDSSRPITPAHAESAACNKAYEEHAKGNVSSSDSIDYPDSEALPK
ncbi:uncharacterized protein FIBRA_03022 [Fibroporia radiculosa]|uniref:Aquaporin n=1 Tax=Fibroporia radiculosa TaxID=599839 RepID=J4H263_9APHY|nr:uncharacterized protein FIBRA_03022 [Fibroporia radiculosa]CCM00974.1 predicted protein [Fibroporia radiculosa]